MTSYQTETDSEVIRLMRENKKLRQDLEEAQHGRLLNLLAGLAAIESLSTGIPVYILRGHLEMFHDCTYDQLLNMADDKYALEREFMQGLDMALSQGEENANQS